EVDGVVQLPDRRLPGRDGAVTGGDAAGIGAELERGRHTVGGLQVHALVDPHRVQRAVVAGHLHADVLRRAGVQGDLRALLGDVHLHEREHVAGVVQATPVGIAGGDVAVDGVLADR